MTLADAVITLLYRTKHRSLLDNSKCLEALDIANIAKMIKHVYDEAL
jgi:hypothetical protein